MSFLMYADLFCLNSLENHKKLKNINIFGRENALFYICRSKNAAKNT